MCIACFLQMAFEYPDMVKLAANRLDTFISSRRGRMRTETPDLGDLLFLLCVSSEHRWQGAMQEAFVIEAGKFSMLFIFRKKSQHLILRFFFFLLKKYLPVRRSAYQMGDAAKKIFRFEEPANGEDDIDQLLQLWADETNGGMVTSASVAFLNLIARPGSKTMEEVARDSDLRWGRLQPEVLLALRQAVEHAKAAQQSVPEIVANLLDRPMSRESTAELLLYGFGEKNFLYLDLFVCVVCLCSLVV